MGTNALENLVVVAVACSAMAHTKLDETRVDDDSPLVHTDLVL